MTDAPKIRQAENHQEENGYPISKSLKPLGNMRLDQPAANDEANQDDDDPMSQ